MLAKMGTTTRIICFVALVTHAAALITSPPRIVKQPTQEELLFQVARGHEVDKPFIIECEAEGEPAPKYRWIKNGKPFEYTSYDNRISQQPGRGTLVVSAPREEDIGQYQCFATNEWGTATSNSVFVRKAELNSFKEVDEEQTMKIAQEGAPYKLTCEPPDGHPSPKVYWMLQGVEGQLKTINNSRMTLDPEGNLWFSNVTRNDASVDLWYTCAAKSLFRNEYKLGNKVFLKVQQTGISPALNKHEPVRQYTTRRVEKAMKGKRAELYCIYGGTPLPQVVWKKNGKTILSSQSITQDNYGKTLVLRYPSYEDEGTYTCEVSNGVGTAQSYSIDLKIEAAPFFTVEPEIQNLAEGETAVIRCKAGGTPVPQISWVHNGKPIEQSDTNQRRQVTADTIIITDLVKKDTGNYGCNATNSIGYVYKDIYINVQSIPPEIKEGPDNITKVDGSVAVLRCRVFGAPKPIIRWMRDDVDITGGKYNITADGDLVIPNVAFTDVGTYQCYAKNKFGEKSAFGSLTVKKRTVITDKPEHYEVAAKQSATFRCNANADDSLQLNITWYHKGEEVKLETGRFKMTNDYSLLISDTQEMDSGEYTCVARTQFDEARAQATLTVQDKPNAPALEGVECHERTATIRWSPKGDNRAPILRFSIQYNTSFTPDSWDLASDNVPAIDTSWVAELSPWANYTFRVIAWNKIGPSLPSPHSELCTTQPDVPHKNPDNVEGKGTDPTNMLISWSKMAQIEHNGPGFHYVVHYRPNISGSVYQETRVMDWQQTNYLVENLPTFQPYKIKVVAVNSKGTSNVTPVEVIGWSGEDTPLQKPENFTLVQVTTGTTALLSWNPVPPESLRGHFKGYKIQTWLDGDEDRLKEILVKADATSALVTKFRPFKKNNARILAYNGRYNGPPSDVLSFVTPEGKPGSVQRFEAYPIGSSAMLLKWDKPLEENGVLSGYKVYYQKVQGTQLGPLQERKKEIDPKFDRAKLAGLEPATKYRIEIRAKTRAGEGDKYYVEQSTRAQASAKPDVPTFEAKALPGQGGAAHILVQWYPALDGHAGTHFAAWFRPRRDGTWLRTGDVTEDDHVLLTGLQRGLTYEVKVTAHDGDYYTTSDTKYVDLTALDGPVVKAYDNMANAGWFIGVMVALAFLVLVLVLVCVARRNRGGKYDVQDRELAHGRRDYTDAAFHEYTHPLDNKSRHSMSSGTKPGPESDTDSMAEYGEGETAGMAEDGSFIGQYGRKRRPPASSQPDSASQAFATLV